MNGEDQGYANPNDHVDRLGRLFSTMRLHDKYGITFERYLQMVESGTWAAVQGDYVAS